MCYCPRYFQAIDYWVGMCMIFVFAALLEFALVNTFVRRSTNLREKVLGKMAVGTTELSALVAAVSSNPRSMYFICKIAHARDQKI